MQSWGARLLVHQLGAPCVVYGFSGYWVGLLIRNGGSSVKILSLLLRGATEFWVSLGESDFFSLGDGPFFHGVFFVRSGFLSNNSPLGFAILHT